MLPETDVSDVEISEALVHDEPSKAHPRMRVLLLNNYEMDEVLQAWKQGLTPAHHLWGASHFARYGIDVRILPFQRFGILNKYWRLQRALKRNSAEMIALDQQLRALCHHEIDVIYAACQNHTFLLGRLKRLGVLHKPLVAVVHHPISVGDPLATALTAHDLLLCLSRGLRDQILANFPIAPERVVVVDWGPDIVSYGKYLPYESKPKEFPLVVAAGKTERDYDTFLHAVHGLPCRVEIYCSADSMPSVPHDPGQVRIKSGPRGTDAIRHRELCGIARGAYALAIPLRPVNRLAGLTGLLDGIALGRPVVMTRNRYIDIDIEKEGIGYWVEPGDVGGWRRALVQLLADTQLSSAMGHRARDLGERKLNLERFSETVARALLTLRRP
jgi:glycosyltransferase involved in cell wall biosynthesis